MLPAVPLDSSSKRKSGGFLNLKYLLFGGGGAREPVDKEFEDEDDDEGDEKEEKDASGHHKENKAEDHVEEGERMDFLGMAREMVVDTFEQVVDVAEDVVEGVNEVVTGMYSEEDEAVGGEMVPPESRESVPATSANTSADATKAGVSGEGGLVLGSEKSDPYVATEVGMTVAAPAVVAFDVSSAKSPESQGASGTSKRESSDSSTGGDPITSMVFGKSTADAAAVEEASTAAAKAEGSVKEKEKRNLLEKFAAGLGLDSDNPSKQKSSN